MGEIDASATADVKALRTAAGRDRAPPHVIGEGPASPM
jgi:hypothetical protein